MEQYKNELKAALDKLATVSEELLKSVPYTADYENLLFTRNELLHEIRNIEDRRRRAFFQTEEENDDREEDQ